MNTMSRLHQIRLWLLVPCLFVSACLFGCNSLHLAGLNAEKNSREAALGLPGKQQFRVSQFLFYHDFEIDKRLPIFKELANLREQVYKQLRLPNANAIVYVYLFKDKAGYESYMKVKYPELPKRRAFFVAQPRGVGTAEDLLVYTYWGERIQEDLRHELTHALLHSVLREVPLWLDEGLAEYFEVPSGWKGVNYQHLDFLRRDDGAAFKPDLDRLERLGQVQQMASPEYRESWAWVHFMLHSTPQAKKVLVKYLQDLRINTSAGSLRQRLAKAVPQLDAQVEKHLAAIDQGARPLTDTMK